MCKECVEYAKDKDIAYCLKCGAPINTPKGEKEASEKNDFFKHGSMDLDPKEFKERTK